MKIPVIGVIKSLWRFKHPKKEKPVDDQKQAATSAIAPAAPGTFAANATPAQAPAVAAPVPAAAKPNPWLIALKATAVALAGGLIQQIASNGIDTTPLAALPPAVKLGLSLAAPLIAAYFANSPLNKK